MLSRSFTVAAAALVAATVVSAQTLSPKLEPGLWETNATVLINGKDLLAGLRLMQEQMMAQLPAEQRKQMAATLARQGMQLVGGKLQQCMTKADTERATRPAEAMAEMRRQAPNCSFDNSKVDGNKVSFTGRCNDPKSFTGDIIGEVVIDNAKAWHGSYGGQGTTAMQGAVPGIQAAPDGKVHMQMTSQARWLGADCGSVKPAQAAR